MWSFSWYHHGISFSVAQILTTKSDKSISNNFTILNAYIRTEGRLFQPSHNVIFYRRTVSKSKGISKDIVGDLESNVKVYVLYSILRVNRIFPSEIRTVCISQSVNSTSVWDHLSCLSFHKNFHSAQCSANDILDSELAPTLSLGNKSNEAACERRKSPVWKHYWQPTSVICDLLPLSGLDHCSVCVSER